MFYNVILTDASQNIVTIDSQNIENLQFPFSFSMIFEGRPSWNETKIHKKTLSKVTFSGEKNRLKK